MSASARSEIERRRQESFRSFQLYCAAEADQVMREHERKPAYLADPFANARQMAEDRQRYGAVRPETFEYSYLQNGSKTLESVGRAFTTSFEIRFDGEDFLDQRGDRELPSRALAVMGAQALQAVNPEMNFYTQRTIYEFAAKKKEKAMMQDKPTGTVMGRVSPCETVRPELAKRAGMFPERNMAVVQLSRKKDEHTLEITCFSLDEASPDLLRAIYGDFGTELPQLDKSEDMLLYEFYTQADTKDQLHTDLVKPIIERFDHRLQNRLDKITRQGQVVDGAEVNKNTFWSECKAATALQLKFDEAMSHAAESIPQPLDPHLRRFAQKALHWRRSNGGALLSTSEQTLVRNLLAADRVTIADPAHAEALTKLKYVNDTGIDEAVRNYFNGDKDALRVLEDQASGDGGSDGFFDTATTAAEAGRFATGCGEYAAFGGEAQPDGDCVVSVERPPCCGHKNSSAEWRITKYRTTCLGCGATREAATGAITPGRYAHKEEKELRPKSKAHSVGANASRTAEKRPLKATRLISGKMYTDGHRTYTYSAELGIGGVREVFHDDRGRQAAPPSRRSLVQVS